MKNEYVIKSIEKFLSENIKSNYPLKIRLFGEFSNSNHLNVDVNIIKKLINILKDEK
jgi:hypothetical protein